MVRAIISIVAFAALTLAGCAQDKREAFFSQPRSQWAMKLAEMPINVQYNYYIYGMKYVSPPAMELALPLASSESSFDYVTERLYGAKSSSEVEAVSYVLVFASDVRKRDICADEGVKLIIMQKYSRIDQPYAKEVIARCR